MATTLTRPALEPRSRVTIGEKYGYAMQITDEAEAASYFEACVQHNLSFGVHSREEAETVERQNLGYFAGYYDHETRARVERLFSCAHPIFGAIAQRGAPTAEEAFAAGVERVCDDPAASALEKEGLR